MNSDLLEKRYIPGEVEERWYSFWESEKLFAAKDITKSRSYSIVIPPPNVTGVLHMGHALNNTLQDILCRYRRLKGYDVLWIPGTDHAGIATQNVVEKSIELDGDSRHKLGRLKFIESVWEWRELYGSTITNQMKRLGASCDWDRERFTMDKGLSIAVRKVFVSLYDDGLIYKGNYIINWCTRCHTALSDLEVEHEELDGYLYKIRYPYAVGPGSITVATTRPETMLGDMAIAVHPEDDRYNKVKNRSVVLPLVGREIPILMDKYVDKTFGTGALKITPAHDPNDFDIALRHNLSNLKVIDDNGTMNSNAGEFEGLERYECREKILKVLRAQGLLESIEPHRHSVGHCYRCKTIVEPTLSKQWFVRTKPLAKAAINAVDQGKTRIIPSSWTKTYYDWMLNIKDWCISRQIWWGHQIPAWTCHECDKLVVAVHNPDLCPNCGCSCMIQETDVLDTWFSSSLWPFSTMGWPEDTNLLRTYYPTSVLVTGFDILFFWVARMMMMGLYFMKEIPFRDVYVHALVRDEDGKKMSKSKGNVIDPIGIIDQYGTDAFRFTLAAFAAQGRDIKMCEKRVDGYRNFVNKLWNAARFSLMHVKEGYDKICNDRLTIADFWVLIRFERLVQDVNCALEGYKFNEAADCLYKFVWHEFCDWYLEAIKPTLYGEFGETRKNSVCSVLWFILRDVLILLHPFLPFITEEIWHKLPGVSDSIMRAKYPEPDMYMNNIVIDQNVEGDMNTIIELITSIRNVRGEMNIAHSIALDVIFHTDDNITADLIKTNADLIVNLARLKKIKIDFSKHKPEFAATVFVGNLTVFVLLKGIVDFYKETIRLKKEINKVSKELIGMGKKLSNHDFLSKAPKNIVDGVKEKYDAFVAKRHKIEITLNRIQEISEF